MGLFEHREATGVWWRDHSLSIVLAAIVAFQLAGTLGFGWFSYSSDAEEHHQAVTLGGYAIEMTYQIFLSIIADTYGVLLIVLLSKWFYERGSQENASDK